MDPQTTRRIVDRFWDEKAIPTLESYIAIPNLSPYFDPEWKANGHMDRATKLLAGWAGNQGIRGARLEVVESEGKTPLIFIEVEGTRPGTVLLYGHLDKQPEMSGWDEGLGPWKPVWRGERLYGRGAADDGYAIFAALAAIRALQDQKTDHPRLVVMIEGSEESGSFDLPWYVDHLKERIGTPELVVCLDSGCGDYERLWVTTSLRGVVTGSLRVEVLTEGVHSGDAGGIVPSSFRVLRHLLDRLEDAEMGRLRPEWLYVEVPPNVLESVRRSASILGDEVWSKFPLAPGVRPVSDDPVELLLGKTWRPSVSYVGIDGMPGGRQAGNVLRPFTDVKLSIRIPPTLPAAEADRKIRELLTSDPPHGARVTWSSDGGAPGWLAPEIDARLDKALDEASKAWFGAGFATIGEGGSIPFMGMLHEKFPEAQFVVTGVLGPHSNAHGPNEFLDLPTAKKVSACVAAVIAS
ncbi:MAG: M20/M25/M40 family metallo-hydrolase [Thermoanaerobaculia bacterium]